MVKEERNFHLIHLLKIKIHETKDARLPSIKMMAAEFNVSHQAVAKAAKYLQKKGLLIVEPRKRIKICGRKPSAPKPKVSAVARIYNELKREINDTSKRAGQQLPKISTLASELYTSKTTVLTALEQLKQENLVFRKGKRWYAGPFPRQDSIKSINQQPTIIIILDRSNDWIALSKERTRKFIESFRSECARYGVRIETYFFSSSANSKTGEFWDQINQRSKELNKRLLGVLAIPSLSFPEKNPPLLNGVLQLEQPLVIFDPHDKYQAYTRKTHFTRCHFCEAPALELAIEIISKRKHKRVIVPYVNGDPSGWQYKRIQKIKTLCLKHNITFENVQGTPKKIAEVFGKMDPSREKTVILALQDYFAFQLYYELVQNGIRIPEDFSMLSFDNYIRIAMIPVNTIDFGFGYLGYCGFHRLFGMIRIPVKTNNNLPSQPHLVDQGSILR